MRLTKKRNSWVIRDRSGGRDRIIKAICRVGDLPKIQVEKIFFDYVHRVTLGYVDPCKKAPSLNEFLPVYFKYMQSKGLRSAQRNIIAINNFSRFKDLGRKSLSNLTKEDIMNYKTHRLNYGAKKSTINRELGTIRAVFNACKKLYEFRGDNPINSAEDLYRVDNKRERVLSAQEQERLLKNCPPHLKRIVIFALHSGCRKGEITSLKWSEVNLESETHHVTITCANSKNGRSRKIPLNRTLFQLLSTLKKTKRTPFVFTNRMDRPYQSPSGLDKSWRTTLSRAKLENFVFHDLRHSFCSRLVNSNVPLMWVKELAGHADISTTQRYANVKNELKGAVLNLDEYRKKTG